jgi:hypothetical protein
VVIATALLGVAAFIVAGAVATLPRRANH